MTHKISIGGAAITVPDSVYSTQGCVIRLNYDGKFIYLMAKTLIRAIESIHSDLRRYRNPINRKNPETFANNLYTPFYKHVTDHPEGDFTVEILLTHTNGYYLLKECQLRLYEAQNNPDCLNATQSPYIPKLIQSNKPGKRTWWITRGALLNFMKWRKKFTEKSK